MVDGIKYEKIGNKVYEMALFDDNGFEIYLDEFTHHVKNQRKPFMKTTCPLIHPWKISLPEIVRATRTLISFSNSLSGSR